MCQEANRRPSSPTGSVAMTIEMQNGLPKKHGLYDPANEKDSCGVGFIAHVKGVRSHSIVRDACAALVARPCAAIYSAAAPATCGAAMLVPLIVA